MYFVLFLQILLPLVNQYFKNHCLYFLSTPAKVLGSGGHSSNKEKEMIARYKQENKVLKITPEILIY